MKPIKKEQDERASRIFYRINEYHLLLDNIYENLVDEDFLLVKKDTIFLIMELKFILKSMEENDF
jgi:hypothetical protein